VENLDKINEYIDRHSDEHIEAVRKFVQQPGISFTGEGMRESAEIVLGYMQDLGAVETKLVPMRQGYPLVYGKLKSKNPEAKTLIFHSKYDVTPVEEGWLFPPFGATVVDAEEIGLPSRLGKVMVGKASHDKKAPDLGFILAQKAMLEVTGDIPVSIIFCLEGAEQAGSVGFDQFIDEYVDELGQADAVWAAGSYRQDQNGKLIIHRGYKGAVYLEIEVKGGDWGGRTDGRDLWSGHSVWVDAPLVRLIQALSSLFDSEGRIIVEGFYDNVRPPTPDEEEDISRMKETFDEQMWKREMGIKKFKRGSSGRELFADYVTGPLINIDGMVSGYTGPGLNTILPMEAIAKLDVRLVPNMEVDEVVPKIKKHLEKRGFSEVGLRTLTSYPWARSPRNVDICQALIKAAEAMGIEYSVWPTSPAGYGVGYFNRPPLNLPVAFGMLGHGGNFHRPNEYVTLSGISDSIKYAVNFLHQFASM